jgi:Na+-driven multidrug efflux pump
MEPILRDIMKASGEVYEYAASYLRIILYGAIFAAMSPGLTHFIRSDGHPKTSMLVQIVGAVMNIILDPIFIFVFDLSRGRGVGDYHIAVCFIRFCFGVFFFKMDAAAVPR